MVAAGTKIDELIALGQHQNGKVTASQAFEFLSDYKTDDDLVQAQQVLDNANITIVPDEMSNRSYTITPENDWAGSSMDSIAIYLNDIGHYPVLPRDQELELAIIVQEGLQAQEDLVQNTAILSDDAKNELTRKIKAGVRAKNKLIEHNLRFVVSIAKVQQKKSGMPLLDLIQCGNMGLMAAVDKFDPYRGFRLATYASRWINQSITRHIAKQGKQLSLPVYISDSLRKVKAIECRLRDEMGFDPTDEMIANEAGMSSNRIHELKAIDSRVVSFNAPLSEENGAASFEEVLEDENAEDPVQYGENKLLRDALLGTMDAVLNKRETTVLRMRFGIDGPKKTLDEVGAYLHVTRERVRQIESRALRKMRDTTKSKTYIDFLQN